MNVDSRNNESGTKRRRSSGGVCKTADNATDTLNGKYNVEKSSEYEENENLTDNEDEGTPSDSDEDNSLFPFPPDDDVEDMLKEVEYNGSFPTITERYFTPYYKLNVQSPLDDICILMHSNRICMLTLAPSHIIFQAGLQITNVDFKVSEKLDRVLNKVSGKSKHGAQPLQTNSNICIISCSNEKTYIIKCCIIGKLVEVNEALLHDPKLLLEPPHRGGYLAIVLPNIKLIDKIKGTLLTKEQYNSKMLERQNQTNHLEIPKIDANISLNTNINENSIDTNNETERNENQNTCTLSPISVNVPKC